MAMRATRDPLVSCDSDWHVNGTLRDEGGSTWRAMSFLLRQRRIGGDFGPACIHVVDIEGCVGTDKSGTCRGARELMHVFARDGLAPRYT